ncbi:MAG: hypothetical protein DCF21_11760 [Leptolyngbya sp.]|jgi:hypothetical protein|uniref:Protein-glutamine gamma-glutamyltransferase-like C-terminal domain-containing protein n=1 Tax=Shackletoniella antarctica TaxID=268115 RepID=A0A2W4WD29_9CYAN|nr:MAG: hypothetical protein DCF17_08125 [Shackletoniella antarctica]PZV15386.1 MAG: hypothetical protein DCF21_11760 [Leptolyngbya sp.]
MADLPHRINSPAWQLRQAMQNLGEWFEYQFSRIDVDGPEVPRWPWLGPVAEGLFWVMVAALTLWTGWLIYRGLVAYLNQRQAKTGATQAFAPTEAALKQAAHWWREAQRLAQQGDYAAACKALYMAGLARLNDTERVLYRASRTDGEYLDCMAANPSRPYELLIRTHERITYGDAPATEETYQRCRRAYQEIAQP